MQRKPVTFITGIIVLFFFSLPQNIYATSWAYSFVVWDGYVYQVTVEEVERVGDEIGEVTAFSDMDQLPGNFSNDYREGTKYYSIEGTDTSEAIAVEISEDQYVKAYKEHEYGVKGITDNTGISLSWLFLTGLLAFVGVSAYQFRKNMRMKS
ncbi:hypothetical protein JMA_04880 [Jeotgalibacillus malaysiensis]|uniref:Uncharacterized protein n=1 Tax=Jeotgalibacillus malaysiensis TaxID=1508404 RepID=A0A0B5AHD0_9BACL|nr:hypothetical protein [Jeotgalibacillus malaysiensis]AJD89805.1 hypothetical protein JMA_04880 [Jeotgalibacillus malaysiensis]